MILNSFIIIKRISTVFTLLILSFALILPDAIRDMKVFFIVVTIAFILASLRIKDGFPKNNSLIYLFIFSFLCCLYVLLSMLFGNWTENYIYDSNFIFRHSYFALMMPIFILASMLVFRAISKDMNIMIENKPIVILLIIILVDILLAYFLGNHTYYINNGYTFYLEKGFIWFLVCYVVFYCMANKIKSHLIFLIITLGFFSERILGYGTTFNATTGAMFYLIMVASYILWGLFTLNQLFYSSLKMILIFVLFFLFIAPYYSDYFIDDLNIYWRLESWKSNIETVFDNYTFGAGFGVSYFPSTQEVIDSAYRAYKSEGSNFYLLEHMFVRGQHSSIINIFFRVGVIGFVMFLLFLTTAFYNLHEKGNTTEYKYLAPIFVCSILNISVHVGLESPPLLITFSMATGFLIEATQVQRIKYI